MLRVSSSVRPENLLDEYYTRYTHRISVSGARIHAMVVVVVRKKKKLTLPTIIGPKTVILRTIWNGLHPSSHKCVNTRLESGSRSFFSRCSSCAAFTRSLFLGSGKETVLLSAPPRRRLRRRQPRCPTRRTRNTPLVIRHFTRRVRTLRCTKHTRRAQ